MLIYNVTTKVSHQISADWLLWMTNTHLPAVVATQCFEKYQMVRLLDADDEEGTTYAVQYYAASEDLYERYIAEHAPAMRQASFDAWGNGFIAFRSLMEVVAQQSL